MKMFFGVFSYYKLLIEVWMHEPVTVKTINEVLTLNGGRMKDANSAITLLKTLPQTVFML